MLIPKLIIISELRKPILLIITEGEFKLVLCSVFNYTQIIFNIQETSLINTNFFQNVYFL